MPQNLGYELIATTESTEDEVQFMRVVVEPRFNGKSFFADSGYAFDVLALLVNGAHSATFDLFTCGCGVAGCAGINEDFQMIVDETSVTWLFPAEPFKKAFADGVPLEIRVARSEYDRMLSALEADLETLRKTSGQSIIVAIGSFVDDEDLARGSLPFADYLAQCRVRREEWLAWIAENAEPEVSEA